MRTIFPWKAKSFPWEEHLIFDIMVDDAPDLKMGEHCAISASLPLQ